VRDYSLGRPEFPVTQRISDLARLLDAPIPVLDPWGNPYRYERVGTQFHVASAGPDGKWERQSLAAYASEEPTGDDLVLAAGRLLTK
jgi:hypothetical protein